MLALRLGVLLVVLTVLGGPWTVPIVVTVLTAASFAVAGHFAGTRPAEFGLGWGRRLMLWLREWLSALAVLVVLVPLERWLMRRDVRGQRNGMPVLLIHGYVNNAGAMWWLWRHLRLRGHSVHALNLEPVYTSIDDYAPLIEARLAGIQAASAGAKVALVCHSMGGLAARAYLRRYGGARVERVITLGTPHRGTVLAKTGAGRNSRQMEPGNPWLAELARSERGAWPCPMTSIWSYDDNVVAPRPNAALEGARNLPLAGLGHISLPMCGEVARKVEAELSRPVGNAVGDAD